MFSEGKIEIWDDSGHLCLQFVSRSSTRIEETLHQIVLLILERTIVVGGSGTYNCFLTTSLPKGVKCPSTSTKFPWNKYLYFIYLSQIFLQSWSLNHSLQYFKKNEAKYILGRWKWFLSINITLYVVLTRLTLWPICSRHNFMYIYVT